MHRGARLPLLRLGPNDRCRANSHLGLALTALLPRDAARRWPFDVPTSCSSTTRIASRCADRLGRRPGLVVDVGAHVGNHSAFFGRIMDREVVAIAAASPGPHRSCGPTDSSRPARGRSSTGGRDAGELDELGDGSQIAAGAGVGLRDLQLGFALTVGVMDVELATRALHLLPSRNTPALERMPGRGAS